MKLMSLSPRWAASRVLSVVSAEPTRAERKASTDDADSNLPRNIVLNQVHRHDHHNFEIKSAIELHPKAGPEIGRVETNYWLFVPKSFDLAATGLQDLTRDWRTKYRISVPLKDLHADQDFESALAALHAHGRMLQELSRQASLSAHLKEHSIEALRDLAAMLTERLKRHSAEHSRQFFLSQSVWATDRSRSNGVENFEKSLQSVRRKIDRLRDALSMFAPDNDLRTFCSYVDEHVSQAYVQYLSATSSEFDQMNDGVTPANAESPSSMPEQGSVMDPQGARHFQVNRTRRLLKALQEDEATYRRAKGYSFDCEDEAQREAHLMRLSQFKKFFQAKSFIEVGKVQTAKRINESAALIGTATAGIIAAGLEQFGIRNLTHMASQGLLLVSFGVLLYVLRDRLKDWSREVLREKAKNWIPDFQVKLAAEGREFGLVQETFRLQKSKSKELAPEALALRHSPQDLEGKLQIGEDVLALQKMLRFDQRGSSATQARTLHENIRVNLERHLKFLDDPFKEISELGDDGSWTVSRSRRVYHLYFISKSTVYSHEQEKLTEVTQSHRIVVDKSGILRVESVALR